MLKKFGLFIIIAILIFSAGSPVRISAFSFAPYTFANMDELLAEIAVNKFYELDPNYVMTESYPSSMRRITSLYEPGGIRTGLSLKTIDVYFYFYPDFKIEFFYEGKDGELANRFSNPGGDWAYLSWGSGNPEKFDVDSYLGNSNATEEYLLERNGVIYVIVRYDKPRYYPGYLVHWVQNGTVFEAHLSTALTIDEILDFCDIVPVSSWILDGDAVSAAINGIENVSIFDGECNEIAVWENGLYKLNSDGEWCKIGYRWPSGDVRHKYWSNWDISEDSTDYQYVLAPGNYLFIAGTVADNPELTAKRFVDGECVSETDYSALMAECAFSRFKLMVLANQKDTTYAVLLIND